MTEESPMQAEFEESHQFRSDGLICQIDTLASALRLLLTSSSLAPGPISRLLLLLHWLLIDQLLTLCSLV